MKQYLSIDLKSFYASVECVSLGLDPLTTNLVVADNSRTEKTICLAISPSLKRYGLPGRARLFEVIQKVKEINAKRKSMVKNHRLVGKSYHSTQLDLHPELELDFIIAKPQMAKYMQISSSIYQIYLKYVAPEDIHVYSIDEVFIDATNYLKTYGMTAKQLASKMIKDVLDSTKITATVGIGTNLYLSKVAMDIVAKHIPADENGVRIASLDEKQYREQLWSHRPLTDFWRVGRGYSSKLEQVGLYTMGDIARCSLGKKNDYYNEDLLYKTFGVNAELLIDHAWGYEPCTIKDIKNYKPQDNSISSGQVLQSAYDYQKARLIVKEMTELLALDLVEKNLYTNQIVLTIVYDIENLTNPDIAKLYNGEISVDNYGRKIPKNAHGTQNLPKYTCSTNALRQNAVELYDRIVNSNLLVRRIYVVFTKVLDKNQVDNLVISEQLDLFTDYNAKDKQSKENDAKCEKELKLQKTVIGIHKKFGKNSMLKAMNLQEGATSKQRNEQVGGHKA